MKQGRGAMRLGLVICALSLSAGCAAVSKPDGRSVATQPPWVVIHGDADFSKDLDKALGQLKKSRAGRALFAEIEKSGKPVRFRRNMLSTGLCTGLDDKPVVWWNPKFGVPETPPEAGLYHELMHALQRLRLKSDGGEWMEYEAIGLGEFAASPISENALRRESGLPLRTSHDVLPGMSDEELIKHSSGTFQPDWQWNDQEHGWQPKKIEVNIPAWVELE